jgi:hypothetical protein
LQRGIAATLVAARSRLKAIGFIFSQPLFVSTVMAGTSSESASTAKNIWQIMAMSPFAPWDHYTSWPGP